MFKQAEVGCGRCKYSKYNQYEACYYCGHKPRPEGIPSLGIVNKMDKCEYFEDSWSK